MKSSKLKDRASIINLIYQAELFDKKIDIDGAFENGDFTDNQLKKIDSISKNYLKFKKLISKYIKKGWSWERLAPLERAILIYGAFELSFLDKALVINEMIILTRGFIPGDNYKYINSILEEIAKYYENIKNN